MKKTVTIFIVVLLVLVSSGYFLLHTGQMPGTAELLQFFVILLLVLFAAFIGIRRLRSTRRGEPLEDERSKMVMQRASSVSYFISLYVWVFLIYLKDRVTFDTEELLGTGILAMAVVFAVAWLIMHFRGGDND